MPLDYFGRGWKRPIGWEWVRLAGIDMEWIGFGYIAFGWVRLAWNGLDRHEINCNGIDYIGKVLAGRFDRNGMGRNGTD